jgi:hypothetical protein
MEEVARCIGEKGEYLERGSNLTQAALSAREIADALIDQSKQKNSNCPCSGRVTAHPEITPKMEFCPDWRQSDERRDKPACCRGCKSPTGKEVANPS